MMFKPLVVLLIVAACCDSAPSKRRKNGYNYDQYDEVHIRTQNGTENYKLNINDVVLVLTPPAGLIQAANLIDPSVIFGEYPDVEEILNSQHQEKPEDLIIFKPTSTSVSVGTSSSTSSSVPPASSTDAPAKEKEQSTDNKTHPASSRHSPGRRRYKLPDFIRPFLGRIPNQHEE